MTVSATASPSLSAADARRYRFSAVRVLFCGVLMSMLVAACLYLYHTAFLFSHERLLVVEMKTTAWFVREIGLALPLIVLCLFHYVVYHKHDCRDGVAQREMAWEIVVVAVLIYGVLLPYLHHVSDALYEAALAAGSDIPQTDGKVDRTLLMNFHEWFVRQPVPLGLLLVFHSMRATRERNHPETEVREEPMTVAAYNAKLAAEAAAREEAAAAQAQETTEVSGDTDRPTADTTPQNPDTAGPVKNTVVATEETNHE